MTKYLLGTTFGLLLLLVSMPDSLQADESKEVVARILADWKARQDGLRAIHVELIGKELHPKGRFDLRCFEKESRERLKELGHVPPEDTEFPLTTKLHLDLAGSRARKDMDRMMMWINKCKFRQEIRHHLYDGKQIRVYQPREENTNSTNSPLKYQNDLIIQSEHFAPAFFATEDHPVFWGCGIVWTSAADLKRLKPPPDPQRFLFKGYGEIQGKRCVVVRSPNLSAGSEEYYEFWVDAEHQGAVLRMQLISQGNVDQQIDAEWQMVEGRWFPQEWHYVSYAPQASGRRVLNNAFDIKVARVVFDPAVREDDFDAKAKPGMIVGDVAKDIDGVVGPDGRTLLPLSELDNVSRTILWRKILYWVAAAVAFISLAWVIRRRWRARAG